MRCIGDNGEILHTPSGTSRYRTSSYRPERYDVDYIDTDRYKPDTGQTKRRLPLSEVKRQCDHWYNKILEDSREFEEFINDRDKARIEREQAWKTKEEIRSVKREADDEIRSIKREHKEEIQSLKREVKSLKEKSAYACSTLEDLRKRKEPDIHHNSLIHHNIDVIHCYHQDQKKVETDGRVNENKSVMRYDDKPVNKTSVLSLNDLSTKALIAALEKKIKQEQKEKELLQNEIKKVQDDKLILQSEREQFIMTISNQQHDLDLLSTTMEDMKDVADNTEIEKKIASEKLKSLEEVISNLENTITKMDDELKSKGKTIHFNVRERAKLFIQIKNLGKEKDHLEEQMLELRNMLDEMSLYSKEKFSNSDKDVIQFNSDVIKYQKHIERQGELISILTAKVNSAVKLQEDCKKSLDVELRNVKELKELVDCKDNEINNLSDQLKEFGQVMKITAKEITNMVVNLNATQCELNSTREQLTNQKLTSESDMAKLKHEYEEKLRKVILLAKERFEFLKNQNDILKEEDEKQKVLLIKVADAIKFHEKEAAESRLRLTDSENTIQDLKKETGAYQQWNVEKRELESKLSSIQTEAIERESAMKEMESEVKQLRQSLSNQIHLLKQREKDHYRALNDLRASQMMTQKQQEDVILQLKQSKSCNEDMAQQNGGVSEYKDQVRSVYYPFMIFISPTRCFVLIMDKELFVGLRTAILVVFGSTI